MPADERLGRLSELLGAATKLSDPDDHVGVQNELRSHLMKAGKPAFVEEAFLSFAEARRLVLELGGIPSYPVLADGASPICEFEADPEKLIERAARSAGFTPSSGFRSATSRASSRSTSRRCERRDSPSPPAPSTTRST